MLAKRRKLVMNGVEIERAPLLVPSFSSKGFPDVQKIIEYSSEVIDGPTLVSAYDIHYRKIAPPFDFASLIFLDSGGYEASKDAELSDFGERDHNPQAWNQQFHEAQLASWRPSVPTVLISYDHPRERLPIPEQIERAKCMAPGNAAVLREILLKPESVSQTLLSVESVFKHVRKLADFDVIGVTEKEIGNSVISRMQNIIQLRSALETVPRLDGSCCMACRSAQSSSFAMQSESREPPDPNEPSRPRPYRCFAETIARMPLDPRPCGPNRRATGTPRASRQKTPPWEPPEHF